VARQLVVLHLTAQVLPSTSLQGHEHTKCEHKRRLVPLMQ
jgi:hypothetical protein